MYVLLLITIRHYVTKGPCREQCMCVSKCEVETLSLIILDFIKLQNLQIIVRTVAQWEKVHEQLSVKELKRQIMIINYNGVVHCQRTIALQSELFFNPLAAAHVRDEGIVREV